MHANIFTWDAPCHGHERFNQVLEHIGKALGFASVLINRQQRLVPVSTKCGAMAIHFLHGVLHGTMLPIVASEVDVVHTMLRERFHQALTQRGVAHRPWIWGSGDADDDLEGECGPLPRLPTSVEQPEPVRSTIESFTREIRTVPESVVLFSPVESAVSEAAPSTCLGTQSLPAAVPSASDELSLLQLLAADCQMLKDLETPIIEDLPRLGWLRSQLISVSDRLAILSRQYGIWADDEIRFHLHELAAVCAAIGMTDGHFNRPLVIDPLRFSSWFDGRSLQSSRWAQSQCDVWVNQTKVIGVFKWDKHWFPVLFLPAGDHVTIVLSHRHLQIPAKLVNMLVDIASGLGFEGIRFHHEMPNFICHSACGASAIDFLRHKLLGLSVAVKYSQVWSLHVQFRDFFRQALLHETLVSRPWVWASGVSDSEATEREWGSEDGGATGSGVPQSTTPVPVALPTMPSSSHVCIDTDDRIALFVEHGKDMGDDEIRFHLATLLKQRGDRILVGHEVLPIVLGFEGINFLNWDATGHIVTEKWCQNFPQVKEKGHQIVAVVLEGHHWIPLWFVPGGMVLVIHTFDDIVDYDIFDGKLRWMGLHLGFEEVVIHRVPHGLPSHTLCGAHALAFLAHILLQADLPEDIEELDAMRVNMRASFVQAMYERTTCICPIVWGSGGSGALVKSLSAELCLHGVPENLSEQRASQAIKAIGSEQLQHALQQKQVWRHLKALASNVSFKLVLPAELDATIASNKGKTIGKKSGKVSKAPGFPLPVELDPSRLVVLEGTFRCQQKVLPQLSLQQIGPISSGFVLMTPQEAEPYLKAGVLVSQEPLALVVFHRADFKLQSMLAQSRVMVPCRCLIDNEPVLAEATLIQIGAKVVEKFAGNDLISLDSPDVRTIRVSVFRDEIDDWDGLVKAPVRYVVALFPELKRCMNTGCSCNAWHNTEDLPIREPILDLWRRQFVKFGFKPVDATKADLFCVSIRLPACLLERVLTRSGSAGAYVEPRSADGQRVLQEYMFIWTGKMSLQELSHLKQTNPAVVGLARVNDRRGLRVTAAQAQEVHRAVRPDSLFLPSGERTNYIVGPFPFGLDRQAINRAMKHVQWQCKPLQPAAPQPGRGAMWLVQAVDEPPSSIVHTSHGEILISKQKPSETTDRTDIPQPIASASTLALCGGGPKEEDPWSKGDPWGKFQPVTVPRAAPTAAESVHQIESRIQASIMAKLPQPMEQDDLPDRLGLLEEQFQQMVQKQVLLDGQVQELSTQQAQSTASLQSQISVQSHQLQGQIESQNQSIQAMFENQLTHIRSLLSKRPREDGE